MHFNMKWRNTFSSGMCQSFFSPPTTISDNLLKHPLLVFFPPPSLTCWSLYAALPSTSLADSVARAKLSAIRASSRLLLAWYTFSSCSLRREKHRGLGNRQQERERKGDRARLQKPVSCLLLSNCSVDYV